MLGLGSRGTELDKTSSRRRAWREKALVGTPEASGWVAFS